MGANNNNNILSIISQAKSGENSVYATLTYPCVGKDASVAGTLPCRCVGTKTISDKP